MANAWSADRWSLSWYFNGFLTGELPQKAAVDHSAPLKGSHNIMKP